jgi:hypothetical protein
LNAARREAGFDPLLPPVLAEQLASGLAVPKLTGLIDARIRLQAAGLKSALEGRGIGDVSVPRSWEGVEIAYHLGQGILIAFLGGTLWQAPRPELITPSGFLLVDFTELALRASGLGPMEAHNARNLFADSGIAFAILPSDAMPDFREVRLKSGPGMLLENDNAEDEEQKCSFCPGPYERVLMWARSDRILQLRSQTMTVDQAVQMANSIN